MQVRWGCSACSVPWSQCQALGAQQHAGCRGQAVHCMRTHELACSLLAGHLTLSALLTLRALLLLAGTVHVGGRRRPSTPGRGRCLLPAGGAPAQVWPAQRRPAAQEHGLAPAGAERSAACQAGMLWMSHCCCTPAGQAHLLLRCAAPAMYLVGGTTGHLPNAAAQTMAAGRCSTLWVPATAANVARPLFSCWELEPLGCTASTAPACPPDALVMVRRRHACDSRSACRRGHAAPPAAGMRSWPGGPARLPPVQQPQPHMAGRSADGGVLHRRGGVPPRAPGQVPGRVPGGALQGQLRPVPAPGRAQPPQRLVPPGAPPCPCTAMAARGAVQRCLRDAGHGQGPGMRGSDRTCRAGCTGRSAALGTQRVA